MPRNSVAKAGRLTSASDFRRTYAEGKRAAARSVVAHVRITGEDRPARIGVTTARGLGGAIQRNRAKRRVREATRALREEVRPGADVVLVASTASLTTKFQDMVDNLRKALAEAGGCR